MKAPRPDIVRVTPEQIGGLRSEVLGWKDRELLIDLQPGVRHFGAVNADERVVGCGSCGLAQCPIPEYGDLDAMRFWGVAVLDAYQGRGIGGRIVDEILVRATALDVPIVWANARISAISYYEDRGFNVLANSFTDPLSGLADRVVVLEIG